MLRQGKVELITGLGSYSFFREDARDENDVIESSSVEQLMYFQIDRKLIYTRLGPKRIQKY